MPDHLLDPLRLDDTGRRYADRRMYSPQKLRDYLAGWKLVLSVSSSRVVHDALRHIESGTIDHCPAEMLEHARDAAVIALQMAQLAEMTFDLAGLSVPAELADLGRALQGQPCCPRGASDPSEAGTPSVSERASAPSAPPAPSDLPPPDDHSTTSESRGPQPEARSPS